MSDLKTELTKVMNEWEKPMNTQTEIKKSYGEKVFDFVRANKSATLFDVKNAIPQGNTQSAASTLKTLLDKGIIARVEKPIQNYAGFGRKTQFEYFAVTDKYEAVNKGYWKPKGAPVKKAKVEVTQPSVVATLEKIVSPERSFNPEMFVQDLSLKDAKAVYEVLKGYFSA
jgi:hypothetical protein